MSFEGNSQDILWFFAMFFVTVPPVLRFRENLRVPALATILVFGFYCQAFWMPDFFNIYHWFWILVICGLIGFCYFVCGFIVHYLWLNFRRKEEFEFINTNLFMVFIKGWINGSHCLMSQDYIVNIRRFKISALKWKDINQIQCGREKNKSKDLIFISLLGGKLPEGGHSQIIIYQNDCDFKALIGKIYQQFPTISLDWQARIWDNALGERFSLFVK